MAATKTQTSAPKTEEKEQTIEQRDQRAKVKGKQIMFEPDSVVVMGLMDNLAADIKPLHVI